MDRTNVIGEKVKSLRTAKEISLEELADRTGLAVEQITRIEENIDIQKAGCPQCSQYEL